MTRKLDYTISETVTARSKNRILVPKKYIKYIGMNPGFVAHVTNLNGAFIVSACPTPESKKFMVDKDGAVRFFGNNSKYKIMIADNVVVLNEYVP